MVVLHTAVHNNHQLTIEQHYNGAHTYSITSYSIGIRKHKIHILTLLLSIIVVALIYTITNIHKQYKLLITLLIILFNLYVYLNQITTETVLLLPNLGIQTSSYTLLQLLIFNYSKLQHNINNNTELYTFNNIHSVVINEGIYGNTVIYCLCIIIKGSTTMILPFQNTIPPYKLLRQLYNHMMDIVESQQLQTQQDNVNSNKNNNHKID